MPPNTETSILAPKRTDIDGPAWAQVALEGFAQWLLFWGLPRYETHPDTAKLMQMDMQVPTPVEEEVFERLERLAGRYLPAADKIITLTPAQTEAVAYAVEAELLGENVAQYVATKRETGVSAAYKLLDRAGMSKNGQKVTVNNRSGNQKWSPSRSMIYAKMGSAERICAGSSPECKGMAPRRMELCRPCFDYYGHRDAWDDLTRRWLVPECSRIHSEHYAWAVNELYREYHLGQHRDTPLLPLRKVS